MAKYKLMQHQTDGVAFLESMDGIAALLWDPGVGKALALNTEVPTPTGWTTMGELKTGDEVLAPDGKPTKIIAHDPYRAKAWRLTFSDGTEVVADEDHLWVTEDRNARRRAWGKASGRIELGTGRPQFEVRSTRDIVATLRHGSDGRANHRVAMSEPVEFPETRVGLTPYFLGYWLGDGHSRSGGITVGDQDVEWALSQFYRFRITSTDPRTGAHYISQPKSDTNVIYALRKIGVLNNKHVPHEYLRGSIPTRLMVLRGLMDSDGGRSGNHVEFCSTKRVLAEAVRELACSLGERATINQSDATLEGRVIGRRWRVTWTPERFNPFLMPRKSTEPHRLRDSGRYIVDAADAGEQDVRCLTVDSPTAQYLVTRSWLPTHNTGATLSYVDRLAQQYGEVRVLVVAPLTAADTWVLQGPMFMDSVVKARMLQGSTVDILSKIREAGDWKRVPDAPIKADHTPRAGIVSGNRVTILSMSAGALSSYCKARPNTVRVLQAVRKYKPHLIVLDESHIAKAATSNISKAMYQIGQLAPHRIILTGTVNPKDALDCYGQWRFLAPWTFSDQHGEAFTKTPLKMTRAQQMSIRPWAWGRFRDRYAQMGGYKGKVVSGVSPITIGELHNRVAERSMVVRKEDALDLPPTTDIDIHVTLNPSERKAYDEMRDELAAEMANGDLVEAPNALAKIMKLRQIVAGFVKDTTTGEVHEIGNSLRKAGTEIVNVQLAGEQRVVVFAYFQSECRALAAALAQKGRTVELITGATKASDRLAIRQRFGDLTNHPEQTVLVAQVRTMSLSVNELVTSQHAVYLSPSERRDDRVQSRGRLDRQGQTKPVTFWNVFVPGTVGEVIIETHKIRGDLEKALLDHIRTAIR